MPKLISRATWACVHVAEFIFFRTIHIWSQANRAVRSLTGPSSEQRWSLGCFLVRYVVLVPTLWLTALTFQAADRGDRATETRLILWSLIPGAIRTLAALATSTIDRQLAFDAQTRHACIVNVVVQIRHACNLPQDPLPRLARLKRSVYQLVATNVTDHFNTPFTVKVSSFKYKLWRALSKGVEIPINYVVQKALLVVLVLIFLFPNALPAEWTRWLNSSTRVLRALTLVLLAPLNHWLGRLRVAAMTDIEDRMIAVALSDVRALDEAAARVSRELEADGTLALPGEATRECARAIAKACHAAENMHAAMRAVVRALNDQALELIERGADLRDADALAESMVHAQFQLKFCRAGLVRLERELASSPAWARVHEHVAQWYARRLVAPCALCDAGTSELKSDALSFINDSSESV